MKCVFVEKVNEVVVKDIPVPEINDDQVLIKMGLACICTKTDTHIIQGIYPAANPFPAFLGHEAAGTVVKVGKNVKDFKPGDRVAYKGETGVMAEYTAHTPDLMFKIPDSCSFEEAAMMEVSSCAYSLVRQCVKPGDHVLITGQGCAGTFGLIFAKLAGATKIVVTDPSAFKRERSLRYGAALALDPNEVDIVSEAKRLTDGKGFDVVMEFSGECKPMQQSVYCVRCQGTIGMFGVCCQPVPFDFLEFHCKFAQLIATGHEYAYNKVPYQKMLDFQEKGLVNFGDFVTHKFPFTDVQKGLDLIASGDETILRIGLTPID